MTEIGIDMEISENIQNCRICNSFKLTPILDLGFQPLSGVFLSTPTNSLQSYSLELFSCQECSLVQLGKTAELEIMYGETYGYRSGLNPTMVTHLSRIATEVKSFLPQSNKKLVVLDIGSNDGTFLNNFEQAKFTKVGIDPSARKFQSYYDTDTTVIFDFFNKEVIRANLNCNVDLATSIAMFYDLENPVSFANQIHDLLQADGLWYLEVCYGPWVAGTGSFDTICHEHLEYYSLENLLMIFKSTGFEVLKTFLNDSNGVSIGVLVRKTSKGSAENLSGENVFDWLLELERKHELNSISAWNESAELLVTKRKVFTSLINDIKSKGMTIYAMGASTKGNVLLNYMQLTSNEILAIGEVNESKIGKFTPGTNIPIISEAEVLDRNPDYLIFLPWHFREFAIHKYQNYLDRGGKLIFPLPNLEIYSR
jgi:hypothetical protein